MRLLILSLLFLAGFTLLPPNSQLWKRNATSSSSTEDGQANHSRIAVKTTEKATREGVLSEKPGVKEATVLTVEETTPEVTMVDEHSHPAKGSPANHSEAKEDASSTGNVLVSLKEHLARSLREIEKVPAYTAVLEQQVQKRGRLLDADWIEMKIRRSPFSVYLKWQDDGQEVVYVDGLNDGRLLVHPTKGFASLRSIWRLRPDSQQAMKDFRYPIMEIGIENLSQMALNFYQNEKPAQSDVVCVRSSVLAEGRPATQFDVSFANDAISPEYATSRLIFSQETGYLISVESHGWDAEGKPGMLLELYRYHNISPNADLNDDDFSENNSAYHFHR